LLRLTAGVVAASLAVALASQLLQPPEMPGAATPRVTIDAAAGSDEPSADAAALARIRADIAFWSRRAAAHPGDFVSATEWAAAEVELGRTTGDLAAWQRAEAAAAGAVANVPDHRPAIALRGAALLALHRFGEARDLARDLLDARPADPVGLATLGDASLDLGDSEAAGTAYAALDGAGPSAGSRIRLARLAWLEGRSARAIALATESVALAKLDGAAGERLAWYHLARFELLAATGAASEARAAAVAALAEDPGSWQARVALARLDAAVGRHEPAIRRLDEAIAIVPRPESLARRADLLELRDGPGDARRAGDDRATIEAIADLAADAVYDRTLALYLADHGLDPDRAVALAAAELELRQDVHGHDALAWALLAAGRPAEADVAMRNALTGGTREPRLLYHAGMIAAALGDAARARPLLSEALARDVAFDPVQAARARAALEGLR
jgi:tetratricopeptide (TPR) repeat protein